MMVERGGANGFGLAPDVFRALIDLAGDPVFVLDATSGRVLDVNDAACGAFGYPRPKILTLDADAFVAPPHGVGWKARREQIAGARRPLRFQTTCRRADGSTFPAEVSAQRVRLGDREYVVGTVRDTTDRERMEAALRATEERFRLLVEQLHVGVLVQTPTAEIVLSNPTACELLGVTDDQLRGRTSFDASWNVIHEDGTPFPSEEHPVPRAIATGAPQRQIVMGVFRPTRGDRVWLLVDAEPQVGVGGQVESVVCTFSDITALKGAERALRASEARLREAQRIAGIGSFAWASGGETVVWSDEMHRILGTDPATFVPTPDAVLGLQTPLERERVTALFAEVVASDRTSYEWETRLVRPDGEVREVHVRGELLRDPTGAVAGARGTMQDVTERKRAERALADSEERLRRAQKLEAIGRLAGGIAHDFNNMLSPILGFASMIRAQLRDGDPLREPIEIIEDAAGRAAALTKQLLAFSRHQVVQPQPLDLNDVLSGLERMLRRVLGEDVELTTRLDPDLARVLADPSQIEQIVLNLAINARDAMPRGGRLALETANVSLPPRGDDALQGPFVRLSVTDTGTGIDDATRARLFEPFFTTKDPGKGTGLGLATVYAIVKQARGDVRVESVVGRGTRFEVYLPRYDGPPSSVTRSVGPAPARARPDERILVVEDDDLVRRTTSSLLRAEGYAVLEASNGADALALVDREPDAVALLLSDVVMPGMSGLELVESARARRPALKALLVSGYPADDLRLRAAHVTLLPKPFKAGELLRAVRAALDA